MKKITLTAVVLCLFYSLSGQEDSSRSQTAEKDKKLKIYKTWISFNNEPKVIRGSLGVLYEISDSSIIISNSLVKKDYSTGNFKLSRITYNNIDYVKLRAKNNVGKGALIGTISGLLIGGFLGYVSGDDNPDQMLFAFTAEEKAVGAGFGLAVCGAAIGALCGLIQIKIPINGNLENFNRSKNKLKKFTIHN
jgi:hypothetical protein